MPPLTPIRQTSPTFGVIYTRPFDLDKGHNQAVWNATKDDLLNHETSLPVQLINDDQAREPHQRVRIQIGDLNHSHPTPAEIAMRDSVETKLFDQYKRLSEQPYLSPANFQKAFWA
jgi:hypothetical protein